jgi:hypothetical protein
VMNGENILAVSFLLIPIGIFVTYAAYYIVTYIYYVPKGLSGYAVFLAPRFYQGMNDLPSGIFQQWKELAIVAPYMGVIVYISFWLAIKKEISLLKFLILLYFEALLVEFLFLFLTANGISHVVLQSKSINNGIWLSLHVLNERLPEASFIDKMRYIFQVLCSNNAPYTIPGTTHPAGVFPIMMALYKGAKIIGNGIFGASDDAVAAGWGIIVSLINTLLIPVIVLIARKVYNEKIARFTGIMMLCIPSVCFHFCAMGDVLASLFIGCAILAIVYYLSYVEKDDIRCRKVALYGVGTGIFFTLAAQMTFGHVFPILSLLISLFIISGKGMKKWLIYFVAGMLVPAVLYFVFERYVGDGKLFYVSRALNITHLVGSGLDKVRPYPLSQIANFIIIFVFGGILVLPTIIKIVADVVLRSVKARWIVPGKVNKAAAFLTIAAFLMFALLVSQKTVRLETERTWHWFFVPLWVLMGYFFIAANEAYARLFRISLEIKQKWNGALILCYFQLILTVILAMCLMDYY